MYQEYQPHPFLAPYIETYWVSEDYTEEKISQRILPDGCVDIIFTFNNDKLTPLLVGTMTSYFDISYIGKIKIAGIRFRPGAIKSFVNIPVFEYTDTRIDILTLDTAIEESFFQRIEDCRTMAQLIPLLNQYFIQRLSRLSFSDKQVDYAVRLIESQKGNISATKLAEEVCLSPRQLERRFKESVGISPKVFSRITKFRNLSQILKANPRYSLSDIAFTFGYYDHSHLIKEFKRLTGHTPKE
jgi:AraC-like DNA-binding protein